MSIQVQKKFNMLSTKEWMLFFQYKLSNEREKELRDEAEYDPFLKEALEAFDSLEGRHIVYQSLGYIHSQINEYTGISESKIEIVSSPSSANFSMPSKKTILITIGAIFLALLIGLGLWAVNYYDIKLFDNVIEPIEETTEPETISTTIDSSLLPLDTISTPNAAAIAPAVGSSTTSLSSTPTPTTSKPANPTSSQRSSTPTPISTPSQSQTTTTTQNETNDALNDKMQFEKAQELYKNGKIDESRAILNKLKSYDNNYKNKAENILNNIGN